MDTNVKESKEENKTDSQEQNNSKKDLNNKKSNKAKNKKNTKKNTKQKKQLNKNKINFAKTVKHEQTKEESKNTHLLLNKEYYTTVEAAKLCLVTSTTIIAWCNAEAIKTIKTIGGHRRIPKQEIEKIQKIMGIV